MLLHGQVTDTGVIELANKCPSLTFIDLLNTKARVC